MCSTTRCSRVHALGFFKFSIIWLQLKKNGKQESKVCLGLLLNLDNLNPNNSDFVTRQTLTTPGTKA
ncbi:hypothetical protein E2C01_055770 [Portunus trituberculatus]|uniref:Uncharacterized protein n=1 Tax=Portunus trituberculatus TaxID=210409 RepID=A0A5B7GWF8_PORTR|nr:hypothetical protein [Portunus trituberculatus]